MVNAVNMEIILVVKDIILIKTVRCANNVTILYILYKFLFYCLFKLIN